MQEDVIINIMQKGADIADDQLLQLAASADKVSVATDKLTGKLKTTIQTTDEQTGITRKLVVEDGKLASATEAVSKNLKQQSAAQDAAASSANSFSSAINKAFVAIGAAALIKKATQAIIEHISAVQEVNAQLTALTATTGNYATVSAAFNAASGGNVAILQSMVGAFAELQTRVAASNINVQQFAATMAAAKNAMLASGASYSDAAKGLEEFSKAMADGNISGEEFRKLYTQFPALGNALAQSLGMSVKTMSELGISSQNATKALLDQQEALKSQAEANMTLGQAMQLIIDRFYKMIDNLINAMGGYKNVTKAVLAFVDALEVLGRTAIEVIKWLGNIADAVLKVWNYFAGSANAANQASQAYQNAGAGANSAVGSINALASANDNLARSQAAVNNTKTNQKSSGSMDWNSTNSIEYRASGGPVKASSQYIVGENGPELFVPSTSGMIIPNGGGGSAVSSSGGYDKAGAISLISEGVGRALDPSLSAVNDNLTAILDQLKTMQTASSVGMGGSSGGTGAGVPAGALSAINNYVATGMSSAVTQEAGGSMSVGSSKGSGTAAGAVSNSAGNAALVKQYATKLADLMKRYLANVATDPKFNFTRTKNSWAAYQNYLASIPQDIVEQVKVMAGSLLPTTISGFQARTGASFSVGGSTGADSKLMQLAVSPGEQIDVRTRKQVRDEAERTDHAPGAVIVQMHIQATDADSFRKSQKQILRELAVQLGSAMQRS